jgi:hypothetical protein
LTQILEEMKILWLVNSVSIIVRMKSDWTV